MPEPSDPETGAPPRPLIFLATGLAIALAVAVALVGLLWGSDAHDDGKSGPLTLPDAPAPEAGSQECAALLDALPRTLESAGTTLDTRTLAQPAPQGATAWGGSGGRRPVVLRCGVSQPAELSRTSRLQMVGGVQWLPVQDERGSTWYAVDRPVYVAVTIPNRAGTGPIQRISATVAATLEQAPLRYSGE